MIGSSLVRLTLAMTVVAMLAGCGSGGTSQSLGLAGDASASASAPAPAAAKDGTQELPVGFGSPTPYPSPTVTPPMQSPDPTLPGPLIPPPIGDAPRQGFGFAFGSEQEGKYLYEMYRFHTTFAATVTGATVEVYDSNHEFVKKGIEPSTVMEIRSVDTSSNATCAIGPVVGTLTQGLVGPAGKSMLYPIEFNGSVALTGNHDYWIGILTEEPRDMGMTAMSQRQFTQPGPWYFTGRVCMATPLQWQTEGNTLPAMVVSGFASG